MWSKNFSPQPPRPRPSEARKRVSPDRGFNAVSGQPNRKPRSLAISWYSQLTNRCPRSRDISSQICSKIALSRLPRPCLTAYISGTRALIGQRFSPLDRAGPEVSKNVVKKISRPNPPGRDFRKLESVYLRIAGSTRSAVNQKESLEPWLSNGIVS